MMQLLFMSPFDCLYSFILCLMGLGCPLLRGSSDRRLRRCAATLSDCRVLESPEIVSVGAVFFWKVLIIKNVHRFAVDLI